MALALTTLLLAIAAAALLGLVQGSVGVSMTRLLAVLGGQGDPLATTVVMELRLPRLLSAFVVGALLALAGVLMQVLLRNPLADPYVLGISGGAAVGALVAILLGLASWGLELSAFAGALLSTLLVFALATAGGAWGATRLLLTGVVLAAGWGALISFILALAPEAQLRGMLFWLMGDLAHAGMPLWAAVVLALAAALSWLAARELNVMARGEKLAASLGVSTRNLRQGVFLLASLVTAAAVTVGGSIGFVGLIVPHMVRLVMGSDHRLLLPLAMLGGGLLLMLADTLARSLLAPEQLPVGVITALIGVPLFLWLLWREGRR